MVDRASMPYLPVKLLISSPQASELAGWQAAAAARRGASEGRSSHRYTASAPSSAATPASAIRCWRQVTQAIRRHGTGRRLGVLLRAGGHGQRGHFVTSDGSASRLRAGPGSAVTPGSRR